MNIYKKKFIEDTKRFEEISANKIKCKCGHSVLIPKADRAICSWCKNWVYRTSALEFKYKILSELKKNKGENE